MIIRAERKDKFTVVSNAALEDSRLSFRAKGILVFILSKPDKWQVSERHLAEQGPDGRSAVATALTELANAGYLRRTRTRQPDGTFAWESMIFDEPQPTNEPETIDEPQPTAVTEAQPKTVAEVDHSEPGGSQRSTMAGKTGHGLTVRGKPSHIVNTEQVNTEQLVDGYDSDYGAAAPPQPPPAQPEPKTAPQPPTAKTVRSMAEAPPIAVYRDVFLRTPAKAQMQLILNAQVDDLRRWHETLTYWCGRGWNLTNVAGMLDLYLHPERMNDVRPISGAPQAAGQGRPGSGQRAGTNRRPPWADYNPEPYDEAYARELGL